MPHSLPHAAAHARRASRLGPWLLAISALWCAAVARAEPGVGEHEIVLGQSASFSGSFASQARSYREGALAYFAAVNDSGGVHGRRLRLVSLDDGYVVERSEANTRRLIDDEKVFALVNYMWTNTVRHSLPLAEQAGVPMIGPYTGYEELYGSTSPVAFTTRASFSDELQQIVQHLHTIGLTRIGLLHYDSASGRELLADTRRRMQALGLELQAVGTMATGSKAPAAAVDALKDAELQALVIGASGSDAVSFIRAFEQVRRGRTQYYARSLIGTKQLIEELGPLARGVSVSQTAPNPHRSRAGVAVEYRRLLARLDPALKPDYIGLEGMIVAKVFVEALRRAGPQPTRARLVRALEGMGEFDVGGYAVRFGPQRHHGSRYVDITLIGADGRIVD